MSQDLRTVFSIVFLHHPLLPTPEGRCERMYNENQNSRVIHLPPFSHSCFQILIDSFREYFLSSYHLPGVGHKWINQTCVLSSWRASTTSLWPFLSPEKGPRLSVQGELYTGLYSQQETKSRRLQNFLDRVFTKIVQEVFLMSGQKTWQHIQSCKFKEMYITKNPNDIYKRWTLTYEVFKL